MPTAKKTTPKLNFSVITADSTDHLWSQAQEQCALLSRWGVLVLSHGLGDYVKTIVVEHPYVCKDYRSLFTHFYSKKFQTPGSFCARLHFFDKQFSPAYLLAGVADLKDHYLGYSVIRPTGERCLGRTIIDPHKIGKSPANGYFSMRTKFKTHFPGGTLEVWGFPYMSQDGEALQCGQTSLWSVCRYLSESHAAYQELLPYDFISMTPTENGRAVPYRGMTYADYGTVLGKFGCSPDIMGLPPALHRDAPAKEFSQTEAYSDVAVYVESGIPVLASMGNHVVTVMGHTMKSLEDIVSSSKITHLYSDGKITVASFSSNITEDEIPLRDSVSLVKEFIVIDDNVFPYVKMGQEQLPKPTLGLHPKTIDSIKTAVAPLPEKLFLSAEHARKNCLDILARVLAEDQARNRILFGRKHSEPLVFRLFATTNSSYKRRRLELGRDSAANKIDPMALKTAYLHMPHFLWVMEVAPLSLYFDNQRTGEIVLDPTAKTALDSVMFVRAGGLYYEGHDICSVADTFQDKIPDTFKAFTHNLGIA
jgi:hypothetical protein